jgi:hypothetical protein
MRNRIINGAMTISQRNGTSSVTITSDGQYSLDRWITRNSATSKFSIQQNAGAVTPPAGFTNYLGVTSLSSYSTPAGELYALAQRIEGFNIADLAWGTANAQPVAVSFWVRSSLTGTFSGSLSNSASTRSYIFTYTITAANTWEYKTVTVPGETSGTWVTNNGSGLGLTFDLGSGSNWNTTAGAWQSGEFFRVSGSQSVVGTNGATWYVTGVQLEEGTAASPFENRLYTTELQLCQRYYEKSYDVGTAPATNTNLGNTFCIGRITATSTIDYCTTVQYKVPKRATPSLSFWTAGGTANIWDALGGTELPKLNSSNSMSFSTYLTAQSGLTVGQAGFMYGQWASSSEL